MRTGRRSGLGSRPSTMTPSPALASFKLRFVDGHVRIVPLRDHRGCAFSGPGVDLRGEAARDVFALAAPVVAWFTEREPVTLRSLSIDLGRRRVLATFGALSPANGERPHVLRIDERFDAASAGVLIDLAGPLVLRLAELASAQLARREADETGERGP
jgi:hypothetical protein